MQKCQFWGLIRNPGYHGTMSTLLSREISIDLFQPRAGDENNVIVVGFEVIDEAKKGYIGDKDHIYALFFF